VTRITGTIREDKYTFLNLSRSVLLKMTNVSHISYTEKQNTHYIYIYIYFFLNRAVYGIEWKNIVEPDRPQMTIWCMPIAYWIPKSTNTHPEYVMLIAFPLQQWLHEHA